MLGTGNRKRSVERVLLDGALPRNDNATV